MSVEDFEDDGPDDGLTPEDAEKLEAAWAEFAGDDDEEDDGQEGQEAGGEDDDPPQQRGKQGSDPGTEQGDDFEKFYSSLDEKGRSYFDMLRTEVHKSRNDVKAMAGQVSAADRKMRELQGDPWEKLAKEIKTPEGWGKVAEKYPDFSKSVEELVNTRVRGYVEAVDRKIAERLGPVEQQAFSQRVLGELQVLEQLEPDFAEVKDTPEFVEFVSNASPRVQEMAQSWDPHEVADCIALFKTRTGWASRSGGNAAVSSGARTPVARRNPNAATELPRGSGKGRKPTGKLPDDADALFDHYASQYD